MTKQSLLFVRSTGVAKLFVVHAGVRRTVTVQADLTIAAEGSIAQCPPSRQRSELLLTGIRYQ